MRGDGHHRVRSASSELGSRKPESRASRKKKVRLSNHRDSLATVLSAVHVRVDVDVGDVPVQDAPRSRDQSVRQLRRHPDRVAARTRISLSCFYSSSSSRGKESFREERKGDARDPSDFGDPADVGKLEPGLDGPHGWARERDFSASQWRVTSFRNLREGGRQAC